MDEKADLLMRYYVFYSREADRAVAELEHLQRIRLSKLILLPVQKNGLGETSNWLLASFPKPTSNSPEASPEFQKILDHRGIVLNSPISVLGRLRLGRAYLLQGDKAKAKAACEDFLILWKNADLDIPILKEAMSEYARLQ